MKKIYLLFLLAMFSCNDDEIETSEIHNAEQKMDFVYQGKLYSSKYEKRDSEIIFEDLLVNNVYKNIISNNSYVMLNEGNSITFFDNIDDYLKTKNIDEAKFFQNTTRKVDEDIQASISPIVSPPNARYFGLFEDANYGGKWWYMNNFQIISGSYEIEIPNLGNLAMGIPPYNHTVNLNDQVTSFKFSAPNGDYLNGVWHLVFFKDINYGGAVQIYPILTNYNNPNVGNPFNDEFSSLKLFYTSW